MAVAVGLLVLSAGAARSQSFEQQLSRITMTAAAETQRARLTYAAAQTGQPGPADRETVRAAREAYYSLAANGFLGMTADVEPDWAFILGRPLTSDEQRVFGAIKFQVDLDANGAASVTATTPPPANEAQRAGFAQITGGMGQMLTGFFQTWSMFMITPPLPSPSFAFQLQREAKSYRLSYKSGPSAVVTTFLKNYAITSYSVATPDSTDTVMPVFTPTEDGFVLTGYAGEYITPSGAGNTSLKVDLTYQDVAGLRLAKVMTLDSTYEGQPSRVKLEFRNVAVKKRAP